MLTYAHNIDGLVTILMVVLAFQRYGSGKLSKTTLDGKILWTHTASFGQSAAEVKDYRPTWWAIPPTGDYVYLADGCVRACVRACVLCCRAAVLYTSIY